MEPVNNILVSLDLTSMDRPLISYAAYLAKQMEAREVRFFHAIQAYDLPNRQSKRFPDVETELSKMIEQRIRDTVDEYFNDHISWDVEVGVGYSHAAEEVIEYVNTHSFDLVLLGQKHGENREGVYGRKILSEVNTNLMLVPEYVEHDMDSILAALDFTKYARKAFEWGLEYSRQVGCRLECFHVSDPTRAFFPVTTKQSSNRDQQRFLKSVDDFLASYQLSREEIPCHLKMHDQLTSEAQLIYETARENGNDLIIVGARGDTANVTSLLGNLTESLRLMEKEIPVVIVKK